MIRAAAPAGLSCFTSPSGRGLIVGETGGPGKAATSDIDRGKLGAPAVSPKETGL
jgi:hypothetical protein